MGLARQVVETVSMHVILSTPSRPYGLSSEGGGGPPGGGGKPPGGGGRPPGGGGEPPPGSGNPPGGGGTPPASPGTALIKREVGGPSLGQRLANTARAAKEKTDYLLIRLIQWWKGF